MVRIEHLSVFHLLNIGLRQVWEAAALGVAVDADMIGIKDKIGVGKCCITDITHCCSVDPSIIIMMQRIRFVISGNGTLHRIAVEITIMVVARHGNVTVIKHCACVAA